MTQNFILAIDQGTTSSRAIIFDLQGNVHSVQQKELTLHYPHNGWVEQDANDIWHDVVAVCRGVISDMAENAAHIRAIGIANQRETTIVWDRKTGKPVYNAIVWQDRRTADQCAILRQAGHEKIVSEKTGLLLDSYFSALKLAWILDHVPDARVRAERGELAFGTVDSFILWHLTGGCVHATDATNASRTMLFNIVTQQWDDDLLRVFNIPRAVLPDVHDCAFHYGDTAPDILGCSIPVCGIAGDQQAALIGQACFDVGMVKSTYGTGCFALMNIGSAFRVSRNRLLTTVAYRLNGKVTYAVEGSVFVAGAAIQWLRDAVHFFSKSSESELLALSVEDSHGVYFVPAFTGLGAPYWDPDARGAILGLTRDSTSAHITRAALEAQAYQTMDLMGAMQDDSGHEIAVMRIDGGLAQNGFMCQFLADMLGKPVDVPVVTETTAMGAAYLAALGCGLYQNISVIRDLWQQQRRYDPVGPRDVLLRKYVGWQSAIASIRKV